MECLKAGESNGNLPLRLCPGSSMQEPYKSPDWGSSSYPTSLRCEGHAKKLSVVAEMFHAGIRRDLTKLIFAFHNFTDSPLKEGFDAIKSYLLENTNGFIPKSV